MNKKHGLEFVTQLFSNVTRDFDNISICLLDHFGPMPFVLDVFYLKIIHNYYANIKQFHFIFIDFQISE